MKYVVVSGGVVSGLGKGITASSIGMLLQHTGLNVTSIKIDPYMNKDAGTMSPYEHGEVYVLDDGGEADLDLGNYERFMNITLTRDHNITSGKVYDFVIQRERRGDYLGKTVQVVPHVTDAIQEWIQRVAQTPVGGSNPGAVPDVCIIELGGTVGDIESMVFIEALRQFHFKVGRDNFCHVHVSLVPVVGAVGEQKSKPIQHSVRELRAGGLTPDIIVCRSARTLERNVVQKISMFCMVPSSHVLSVPDLPNLYHAPLVMNQQRLPGMVLSCLRINRMPPDTLPEWTQLATTVDQLDIVVKIGVVGKYTGLSDSYLSVLKALSHASIACGRKLQIEWVDSTKLELPAKVANPEEYDSVWETLRCVDGILIPGGFGGRGVEGKIRAAEYARTSRTPFLGICLGMQVMVLEAARSLLGLKNANSAEFDEFAETKAVIFMPEISTTQMGGTMRLGSRRTVIKKDTLAFQLYKGHGTILERHRHRYEVNPALISQLEEAGLVFSGKDTQGERMEIVEMDDHPFYLGTQFHPEFQTRPFSPSPPFIGFVSAASKQFVRSNSSIAISDGSEVRSTSSTAPKHPSMDPQRLQQSGSESESDYSAFRKENVKPCASKAAATSSE